MMIGQSCPRVASKEQIVFGKQSAQAHLHGDGLLGARNDARRSAAGEDWRDADTHFVNESCLHQLAVPGWSAFTKHYLRAPFMKFVEHCVGLRSGHGEANNFGVESGELLRICLFAGDDERALLVRSLVVRDGVGKRRNRRVDSSAGSQDSQAGDCGTTSSQSALNYSLVSFRSSVALSAGGARCDQNPITASSYRAKHGAVCGSSEVTAQALDGSGAVKAGDHIDHHPRAVRRCRPRIVQIDVKRVDAFDPGGKNLLHCRRPYRFESRFCRVPPTPTTDVLRCPPQEANLWI